MFTPYTPNFQSLMLMLDAAHMGWWKANFQTGELYVSEYIARLLGLDGDKIRIGQLTHLIREDYRMPIHNEFMALKVGSKFDRTFPVELPEGEVWLHAQLVGRQTDPDTGTHLFGYMQRVPVHDRREAEILTLENNYHTVVKENKHMDVLLDHLPIGYFRIRLLYDSDGRAIDYLFLSVNRAAQQIVGIAPDAYTDKTAREAGLPVDAHIDKLAHIRIGDYKVCEWFAEKTRRHCRSFLYNTPNDETELVILTLDITDAVTAHKALDEQEKLLRNIIQNAPVGIEIYNHRGRLIDINTCDLEMFGVKDPGKIRGLNLFDNPNFPEETKIRIQHGESADFTARYEFGKLDGYYESTRPGHFDWTGRIRCLYDDRGELTHYLLINIDNTELRQIQNRVSEFEALFRIISEYAQVGYANYNLYNKEGYAQNVWLRNYGEADSAQIGDVIGKYRHIHPEDRKILLDLLARFSAGEVQSATAICRVLHDDGRKTWIKTHLICRDYRPGEQIIDMLGINYDITALKQTEQELIAAKERAEESNKLKSAFLANMSHEIRTPLNAIVGFSSILAETDEEQEKREYISIIENNNALLLQLIGDILDLSKIEAGTLEFNFSDFELNELMHEKENIIRMKTAEGVELIFEPGLDACLFHSDRNRLSQLLINLLTNAAKFTAKGSIRFGYRTEGSRLRFYVSDTGCGIPPEGQRRIFDRFVKLNSFKQGTGLGLPICKSIVEHLGGEIGVKSEEGRGTTFWFTLPYVTGKPCETPCGEIPTVSVEKDKLTILIAEDNDSNYRLFETILRRDYRLIHARDGEQAVELCRTEHPHLILMDINMPVMNGYEAAAEIRKFAAEIPIVAVTAYAYASDEQKIMQNGFTGYMPKPINAPQLKKQILDILRERITLI